MIYETIKEKKLKCLQLIGLTISMLMLKLTAIAQNGIAGMNAANSQVRSYFDSGINLMYAVGAIVELKGAKRIGILFQ